MTGPVVPSAPPVVPAPAPADGSTAAAVAPPAVTPPPAAAPVSADAAAVAKAAADAAAATAGAGKIEDLPEFAQKLINELRREAGDHRVKAQTAAEEAEKALTDRLATALGLKPENDPAKLLEQANATAAAKDAQLVGLQREVAARDAATTAGANPTLLLDSATFRTKLNDLNPTSTTFATELAALIATTIEAAPHLKAPGRAPGASGIEISGGSGEPVQITDPAVIKAMTPEQRVEALEKGHLRAYMAS